MSIVLSLMLAVDIKLHAMAAYPRESCGFIIGGHYEPVRNVAGDPLTGFKIQPGLFRPDIHSAIVHSHPDGPECPSAADMRGQRATAVPWVIVSTDGKRAGAPFVLDPDAPERPPLEGRPFRHGVTDCYSLLRDWFHMEQGIALPDYPRDWEWWKNGEDLYRKEFRGAGFQALGEAAVQRRGDVFLAQTPKSPAINHAGVYLGDGMAIHHLTGSDPFDPTYLSDVISVARWQNYIVRWLRHESLT